MGRGRGGRNSVVGCTLQLASRPKPRPNPDTPLGGGFEVPRTGWAADLPVELNSRSEGAVTHTVGAFAYLFDADGRIVLVQQSYAGRPWTRPGGRLEPGESPIDGLRLRGDLT
jgi:hypothetical protein